MATYLSDDNRRAAKRPARGIVGHLRSVWLRPVSLGYDRAEQAEDTRTKRWMAIPWGISTPGGFIPPGGSWKAVGENGRPLTGIPSGHGAGARFYPASERLRRGHEDPKQSNPHVEDSPTLYLCGPSPGGVLALASTTTKNSPAMAGEGGGAWICQTG